MKILAKLRGLFGGSSTSNATSPTPASTDELAETLAEMRGDNITVVDSAGNLPPADNEIKATVAKAKDIRVVNTGPEGKVLHTGGSYRTSK